METSENDLVRTSSLFLIRNAQPRLQPLIVVDAIPNAGGLIPLPATANDLRIRIPVPPQPGLPGSRPSIRVYAELPPPAEYEVLSYQQLPTYPTAAIDITVPRRLVSSEGDYQLTYILDDGSNALRATASTPLRVQTTPPFGYLRITPYAPLLPANLSTPLITEEYLANNDPVLFRIPEHAQINNEMALLAVFYYGHTDSHMQVSYSVPPVTPLPDFPAVRLIPVPASIIRARGNGLQQLTYRCMDRQGNRARDSLILEVRVALRITPSNIAIPRVTQAIAPDNTVTLGDINQGGQGGMEVWLDSVDGLQIGDIVSVMLGATAMPTALTYIGQPIPLRFIITTAQIQALFPGVVNNDTTATVGFRITSGGANFNGPARTLTFNLSILMSLAPPIVQNRNSEGNLNCNSPQPLNTPYPNRSIAVFIPPSTTLIPGRTLTLTCALSRQDDGSNPIAPAVTVSTVLAADAPTLGVTMNVPYSTTMRVIGRGAMYFSYSTINNVSQLVRSPPVAIGVRGVLAGNVYCDGTPFTPTP